MKNQTQFMEFRRKKKELWISSQTVGLLSCLLYFQFFFGTLNFSIHMGDPQKQISLIIQVNTSTGDVNKYFLK